MIKMLFLVLIFSQWEIEEVDSVVSSVETSITIDTGNYPHIAYPYYQDLGGNLYLGGIRYAKRKPTGWDFQWVDTATNIYFSNSRLFLDRYNHPHIAYTKDTTCIKYAYYDGNSWRISTVDSSHSGYFYGYRCLDMMLAEDSIPHLSYPFFNHSDSTYGVRYACKSGDSWQILTLWEERGFDCPFTSIALDNNGHPFIAFNHNHQNPRISYLCCAYFTGQNWKIDTIQESPNSYAYIPFSIKINENNHPCLVYLFDFHIFYGEKIGDRWEIEILCASSYCSAAGDLEMNVNEPSFVFSSTFDPVRYVYRIDTIWWREVVEPNYAALFPSLAKDRNGGMHVSYCRVTGKICYAKRTLSEIKEKGRQKISPTEPLLKTYPNPGSGIVHLYCPLSAEKIKIYNITGKVVKEEKLNKGKIFLKDIKPGVYILKIKAKGEEFIQKLIIK
ncbi:MAG: T9SS type A sorting domain-containing protein [candidate division WOR-3 bacterium]